MDKNAYLTNLARSGQVQVQHEAEQQHPEQHKTIWCIANDPHDSVDDWDFKSDHSTDFAKGENHINRIENFCNQAERVPR